MYRKIISLIILLFFAFNICGCFALLAGAAGGAGTAMWFSGKLSEEVNSSFDRSIRAAKSGLKSLRLHVTKETVKDDIAQIMSNYTDGKTIWIDVRYVSSSKSRIEIRVGASGDKEAAEKILDRIKRYL